MDLKKIVTIIRTDALEDVERRLIDVGVPGITVTRVKGFGEYANFFTRDWMSAYVRLEILTDIAHVSRIAGAIMEAAHTGTAGDGIVFVEPVDRLYRIRDHQELHALHGPHLRDDPSAA